MNFEIYTDYNNRMRSKRLVYRPKLRPPELPSCIVNIIADYAEEKRLFRWINGKIYWSLLRENPAAISILEANLGKVDLDCLSSNAAAVFLLENNTGKIYWDELSLNPSAVYLLEKNLGKIYPRGLSPNPSVIHLLRDNLNEIDWHYLPENPAAISLLEANMDKIYQYSLFRNPAATYRFGDNLSDMRQIDIQIILDDMYVDLDYLSSNTVAVYILEIVPDIIYWSNLSSNPSMIHLLRDNGYEEGIFTNPAIIQSNKHEIYNLLVYGHVKNRGKGYKSNKTRNRHSKIWQNTGKYK